MKRLIIAAAALMALTFTADAQTVRLGTEGAYAPWNFLDDNGQPAGFEIDLGNELCQRAGLTCEWVVNEWDTIIPNLQAGNYDAILAGMSITEERQQTIDFTQNYFPPDPSRYVAAAGASFDFDNLSGVKIGVQGATIQHAYAQEHFASSNTVQAYETADQAMADLLAGNLDVILADGAYLEPVVAGNSAIAFVGPEVLIGNGVGIGLRKQDDELEAKLNAAIDAMKKDGSLDALIAKWFEGRGPYFSS
ncbi:MAG TPA: transporter substrate-binding domain-containing protein [Alphaproteobacteria bacterium]|nr:transporter substrate-binding domain-containing protein [Alphaproteobacteria bacterium]